MNVFAYPKVTAKKLIELGVDRVFADAAAQAAAPRAAAVGRAALAAAAARHVDGKDAAYAAALLIVARETQRAARVNEMVAIGTQAIYFCVAQVNMADAAATEAAAAWARAADEAGFTLFEKQHIINNQAE